MRIQVTKGERADRVDIWRADGTADRGSLPHKGPVAHDLVHYVVEGELGLRSGFWGLVARGNAPDAIAEMAKAAGHASAKRAEVPASNFVEAIQAERIVEAFEAEFWSRGKDNDAVRAMARAGCDQSLVPMPDLGDQAIDRIREELRDVAERWAGLSAGESLVMEWDEVEQGAR